jgi:diguanylate cyclase
VIGVRRIALWPVASTALVLAALVAGAALNVSMAGAVALAAALVALSALVSVLAMRRLRAAESLALRDPLTGLPNRSLLEDRVEQALRRSRRTGEPFAVVALDLDGFKEINDVRGHRAGDQVLMRIARMLEEVVRESDTVARIGGDEFAVLSLGTRDEDEATALVGRLRQALRSPIEVDRVTVEIDASIGWAVHPDDGSTPEELLGRADGQMYMTKRDVNVETRRGSLDAGIVREFETALERNELVVHYQPILLLGDGSVTGIEALVRRLHPERGVVSPAEFIPHVERTALIRAVTIFVAADALRTARDLGELGHHLGVSVNVPYRAIDDPELAAGIESLLTTSGVSPSELTLEIVPSGAGAGGELDRGVLIGLRALGVRIAIDDFGRASSLAAVRTLPLDQVKIDTSFVHGLGRNAADSSVVQALAYLGHELGLEVVAEGVETRLAWKLAIELGCDLAQGFYMAPPSTREALIEWLNSGWPAAAEPPVGATTHLALDLHTQARAAARVAPTKPG